MKTLFRSSICMAVASVAVTCAPASKDADAHPFRENAIAYRVESVDGTNSMASHGGNTLCAGIMAANAGWMLAEVIAMTNVLEAPIGVAEINADPALYVTLRRIENIVGEHDDVVVVRYTCGDWPFGSSLPCESEARVGQTVVAPLQFVEGTNEGFPTMLVRQMGIVGDDGTVDLVAGADELVLADLIGLIQRGHAALAPIEVVCFNTGESISHDRCPVETLIPPYPPMNERGNAWCDPEPSRPDRPDGDVQFWPADENTDAGGGPETGRGSE